MPFMPPTEPKYDVAISFLARDEQVAGELSDLLEEGLNVFFFPRKQEELAGTNGLVSMREPFLTARIVVVLYREPWGNTSWTRVEEGAITERFLKEGWDWLLFVQPTKTATCRNAAPNTCPLPARTVRHQPGALSHARSVQHEAALIADQKAFFRDQRWIEDNIHRQIAWLIHRIAELAQEITRDLGMKFDARYLDKRCVLRDNRVSMYISWRQSYLNDVTRNAEIIAGEFNGPTYLPNEKTMTVSLPSELRKFLFTPTLLRSREVCWVEVGKKREPLSTEELAHRVVTLFLGFTQPC